MFQDVVLAEVAPIFCVAVLWFANSIFMLYG